MGVGGRVILIILFIDKDDNWSLNIIVGRIFIFYLRLKVGMGRFTREGRVKLGFVREVGKRYVIKGEI